MKLPSLKPIEFKTHKVALVKVRSNGSWESSEMVTQAISEWEDVSSEDLEVLNRFCDSSYDYKTGSSIVLIELLDKEVVKLSVSATLELEKKQEKARQDAKQKEAGKRIEAAKKRKEKNLEKALKILKESNINPEDYQIMNVDKDKEMP